MWKKRNATDGHADRERAAELARYIADELKAQGLTQKKAAEILGISQPRVSLIVQGGGGGGGGRTMGMSVEVLEGYLRTINPEAFD